MRAAGPRGETERVHLDMAGSWNPRTPWFELPKGIEPPASAEAGLVAALLPAMHRGEELTVEGPLSPKLLDGVATIRAVWWTWARAARPSNPFFTRPPLHASPSPNVASTSEEARGRTAAFFTGGVDSLYTAITHRTDLCALVYVHGFDVPLEATALREEISLRLGEAAALLGLPLLEVSTDLRTFAEEAGVGWPEYHGAALATVAHLLSNRFDRFLIPATHTYAQLEGLGSHPLLDPLWSTETLAIVHDGADADRIDKLRRIADEPAAARHLRVCWENPEGAYNCGRCEKCVRTGVAIRIAGREGDFPTVPAPSLTQVARALPTGRGSAWRDLQVELRRTGANPKLAKAVDLALARRRAATLPGVGRWFG